MRALRGGRISMVFQDPMTSLNPVLSIGRQMIDIQHRERRSLREKRERAADMLARVGIPDATSRLSAYPHQRSEEHTSELQSLMRTSYAVFCLKKTTTNTHTTTPQI